MGERDRHARATQPFGERVVARLVESSVETSGLAAGSRVQHRPTCKLHKDEIAGLVSHSVRARTEGFPTVTPPDDRTTQQMDPTQFQLLLRVEREDLPLSPDDVVRMHPDEAQAWLDICPPPPPPVVAAGSVDALVVSTRHAVLPTAPDPWWRPLALIAIGVGAIAGTLLLLA